MSVRPRQDIETFAVHEDNGDMAALVAICLKTGMVSVSCPHHHELNGMHYWTHHGRKSLWQFIAEQAQDRSYVIGKLFGSNELKEFDVDETLNDIHRHIIEQRRRDGMTKEVAHELWHDAENCESPDDFARLDINEAYDFIRYEYKPCIDWFWTQVWCKFIDFAKTKVE